MNRMVLSVGELLVDFVPGQAGVTLYQAETFRRAAGGAPANVAALVARLGGRSAFIGRVGDDAFGHWLADTLAETGVDVSGVVLDRQAPTTLAFVSLAADADRDFSFYRDGTADTRLAPEDLKPELISEAGILHFCSVSLSREPARSTTLLAAGKARESGALVSFDVNWRAPLWDDAEEARHLIGQAMELADLIKLSEDELEFLTGSPRLDGASDLLATGARCILLSRGAEGVDIVQHSGTTHVPAFKVNPVDTTGAGDALAGAVLFELARRQDLLDDPPQLEQAGRRACAVAALSTLKPGAIPSYPDAEQLEQFLAQA